MQPDLSGATDMIFISKANTSDPNSVQMMTLKPFRRLMQSSTLSVRQIRPTPAADLIASTIDDLKYSILLDDSCPQLV